MSEDADRQRKQREVIKFLGTFKDFMTVEELRRLRCERDDRHDRRLEELRRSGPSRISKLKKSIRRGKSQ